MIAKKTIGAAIIALSTLAAVPASAGDVTVQFGFGSPGYGWHDGRGGGWRDHGPRRHELSPQEVRRELRERGYRQIRYFDRRGDGLSSAGIEGTAGTSTWSSAPATATSFRATGSRSGPQEIGRR